MPDPLRSRTRPLGLEVLEPREVPTTAPWVVETFQRAATTGLPTGWSQWLSDPSAAFRVDTTAGLGDQGQLVSTANTTSAGRAWLSAPFAADVETSAAVFLNTTVPVQILVRGSGLGTTTPTYYAATITRGAEVKLVKVVRGATTVLGSARSPDWVSNRWVTVTVRAEGNAISAFLYRGDTNQYLGRDGKWTSNPTAAVTATDTAVPGSGTVGFARPAGVGADAVSLDSVRVGPADGARATIITEERFATGPGLPAGWTQWSAGGPVTAQVEADQTLRLSAGSTTEARAWIDGPVQADVQVSSSIYADSLSPAGVIARGSNLATPTPTYYGLTVSRGLEVKLTRVVAGTTTVLGTLRSKDWVSGSWVQTSLVATGDQIRAQVYRSDTGQYLNADGTWGLAPAWAMARTDAAIRSGGKVGLSRGTGYAGPLVFDNFIVTTAPSSTAAPGPIPTEGDKATIPPPPPGDLPGTPTPVPTVPPPPPPTGTTTPSTSLPAVPRHYAWIRLANLAYYGTPIGTFEQSLLRNSIDLVIPNLDYLDDVAAVSPATPQFIYTNVSNVYLNLLTDWNDYADRNHVSRESAFYHVTRATPFAGMSASAMPVNRFWGVYRGSDAAGWTDLTRDANNPQMGTAFAATGQSLALGFVEKFREVNVDLSAAAGTGWAAALEYVAAADTLGRPTLWKTLTTKSDATLALRRDGQVTFDPPKDWVPAAVGGSTRLYYVRYRTTAAGAPPAAVTITGRDYTRGNTIPAFDAAADLDRDGHLNDAEYAIRAPGKDARFAYESRLFYPNYGPMRFATNVSNPWFKAWAVDYHARFAAAQPLARGFFVDNSIGRLAVDPTGVAEPLTYYSTDYAAALGAINAKLAASGKWLVANTGGNNGSADPIARAGVSYLDEFALRPLSANHIQFDDLAAGLAYRRQLSGGKAYEILDSLPTNGVDALDPRLQLATLAMYYAVADPTLSFLMVNGGNEPASGWSRHWIEAATFDVGRPLAAQALFASGYDPADAALAYKVYQRKYEHALVLYKPVSYTRGVSGTTADNTATTHVLDGWYRPVRADGSLGAPVNRVTLRNGEGAILAKVP